MQNPHAGQDEALGLRRAGMTRLIPPPGQVGAVLSASQRRLSGAKRGLTAPQAGMGLEVVLIAIKRRLGLDERALGFYCTCEFGWFQQQQAPADLGGAPDQIPARSRDTPPRPPPRDKFGGVWGDAKKRPGGLVSVGWRGCGEIPSGSAVLLPLGSGEGTSHVPSCTRASPPPCRARHPSPGMALESPRRISHPPCPVPCYPA